MEQYICSYIRFRGLRKDNFTFVVDIEKIYLFNAVGLTPGGSSTVHIYTHKQYTEQHNYQLWLEGFLGLEPRVVKLRLTMN